MKEEIRKQRGIVVKLKEWEKDRDKASKEAPLLDLSESTIKLNSQPGKPGDGEEGGQGGARYIRQREEPG